MEQRRWLRRARAAVRMAERAITSESRLMRYQLAGLYSVRAAQSALPSMTVRNGRLARAVGPPGAAGETP